ncbi:MAG: hypothetical protein ACJAVA_002321 [Flavobacteriaceae bacterium]|jgi:hypothetical protein
MKIKKIVEKNSAYQIYLLGFFCFSEFKKQGTVLIKNTMIMKKVAPSILLSLLCLHLLSAQGWSDQSSSQRENDWSIGFGFNAVYDSGYGAKDLFTASDHWNFGTPFYISAENYINNQFSIGATLSFNHIKEGKVIDGETILKGGNEAGYAAFDLALKYSFRELLNLKYLEPYAFVDPGGTHIGDHQTEENNEIKKGNSRMTLNTGLGCNYWLSKNWGINLNLTTKFGIGSNVSNQLQTNIGCYTALGHNLLGLRKNNYYRI